MSYNMVTPSEFFNPDAQVAVDPLIHAVECVTLLLPLWRKAQVHARIRDED